MLSDNHRRSAGTPGANSALLHISLNAEDDSFDILFAQYSPALRRFFIKRGSNASDAEDLAQDVMRTIWEKAHLFEPLKASANSWIFSIARNRQIDLFRQHKMERERLPFADLDGNSEHPDDKPDFDTDLLASGLDQLSGGQAAVVDAAYFRFKSHNEIATEFGIPMGTVKSRLRLAMVHLRESLNVAGD